MHIIQPRTWASHPKPVPHLRLTAIEYSSAPVCGLHIQALQPVLFDEVILPSVKELGRAGHAGAARVYEGSVPLPVGYGFNSQTFTGHARVRSRPLSLILFLMFCWLRYLQIKAPLRFFFCAMFEEAFSVQPGSLAPSRESPLLLSCQSSWAAPWSGYASRFTFL